MLSVEQAYIRGKKAGELAANDPQWVMMAESVMDWARKSYPASADLDYKQEVLNLERQRMNAGLDLTKFPECRIWVDVVREEHKGFLDGCKNEWMMAHNFNWYWFVSRRLNTRYVRKSAPKEKCTGVWFGHGIEGPMAGQNLDDIVRPFQKFNPPEKGPSGNLFTKITQVGGASSAVLCDEEPEDIFPVDVFEVMPEDIEKLTDFVDFLYRYREFFGPGNLVFADTEMNSVAIEKSNCRMGVRWPENGASAVTACSYLTPEMNAFKKERDKISFELRGFDPVDNPDYVFWAGCEKRYIRLLYLVENEAKSIPTLEGLANIMLDHAVPFPDRICLAGEKGHRLDWEANWTLTSSSSVLFGPTRRTLWWRKEGNTPIYETKPFLILGAGVEMREEWKKGTRLENRGEK
ncbi:MAG: hypothetical protein BWX89_01095 [candidate division TA06 bacterium ADurb.Bin131]|uniref:Uncharacterized protein n=1 Tax=candidate division TA06 bacterium ADurb.Bin131 TaxID=1852827 RepID=A0A1V6C8G7_UNCT6|nr:MAG: hypothetical protein BWX89_01095 [candidate division TA06 bacterium ADurb.Bin131]HOC02581.1 hypothetical protein [bacterium]HQL65325.1 hypothetical protein [bacterium]